MICYCLQKILCDLCGYFQGTCQWCHNGKSFLFLLFQSVLWIIHLFAAIFARYFALLCYFSQRSVGNGEVSHTALFPRFHIEFTTTTLQLCYSVDSRQTQRCISDINNLLNTRTFMVFFRVFMFIYWPIDRHNIFMLSIDLCFTDVRWCRILLNKAWKKKSALVIFWTSKPRSADSVDRS